MINEEFADVLYKRIQPFLPPGTVRCNEYFRFSKYHPGQEFTKHTDGTNQDKYGNRSQYTLNIFLNKDFGGGETEFFDKYGQLAVRAIPEPGRAALFDRGILHCGNKVSSGNKYLLRTDVMVPIPGVQKTPTEEKVITYTLGDHKPQ
jgi:predicted 2-oxoglutarate/Fe(II)-dependent dioxygenase YbiX